MKNRKILVTGGAGFIGSNLIDKLLALGHKIICLDNLDPFYDKKIKIENLVSAKKNPNFIFIEGDIRNQIDLNNCFNVHSVDLVIHLAAKAGVRPSIDDSLAYYLTNVIGTLNLLEVMRVHKVENLIFASSSSVYGNNKKIPFSEEDAVDNPISPYAASKKSGELICHTYHHLFNFNIHCLRFFTVYGPRQRPDLAIHKFTDLALKNQCVPVYGDGTTKRDYTFIEDILSGITSSINNLNGYEIINLGESQTINVLEMINTLEKILDRPIEMEKLPMQDGDVSTTYADISKARKLLGYNPVWNFEDGIHEFVKWKLSFEY